MSLTGCNWVSVSRQLWKKSARFSLTSNEKNAAVVFVPQIGVLFNDAGIFSLMTVLIIEAYVGTTHILTWNAISCLVLLKDRLMLRVYNCYV